MPDDRDRYQKKTPPKGVAAQIAKGPAGTFPAKRPPSERPQSWDGEDTMTGRGLEPLDEIVERQKDLRKRTDSVPAATAKITVEAVRSELKTELAEVKMDVAEVKTDVKGLHGTVGDMRAEVAGISGQLEILPVLRDILVEDRKLRNEQQHVTMTSMMTQLEVGKSRELADVEVKKTRAITEIKEGAAKRKWWRSAAMKIIGLVTSGGVAGWLAHYLSKR